MILSFSAGQTDTRRDGLKSVLRVGGPIFGKATKVATMSCMLELAYDQPSYRIGLVVIRSLAPPIDITVFFCSGAKQTF